MRTFNNDSKNAETNNVIPLRNSKAQRRAEMKLEMNQKRVAISASILSIAFVVGLLNQHLLKNPNTARGIASIPEVEMDTSWESSLADKLSKDARRDIASLGKRPNEMEKLRYEFLEGKYGLRFDNGSLQEIEFDKDSSGRPKYIQDKAAFLQTYKGLFNIEFAEVKKVRSATSNDGSVQEDFFDLIGSDQKPKAKALFKSDSSGRVLLVRLDKPEV